MNPDSRGGLRGPWLSALALLTGLLLATLTWLAVGRSDEVGIAAEEERRFGQLTFEVSSRVVQAGNVLRGLQGLFIASDDVSRAEFHDYARVLGIGNSELGLLAIQYAPWVSHAMRDAFEARVRGDRALDPGGYPAFSIKPPGDRPAYAPTEFNEPMAGNENAFGFDTAYGPVRGPILEAARDTGQPMASPPFPLVQAAGVGVVMRGAVYHRSMAQPQTVAERRAAYAGQVSVVFLPDVLLGAALGEHLGAQTELRITDIGPVGSAGAPQGELLVGSYGILPDPSAGRVERRMTHVLAVYGRFWQVSMHSRPPNPYLGGKALTAGGLVLSLTLLMLAIMRRTVAQRDRAQARASAVLDATLTPIITVDDSGSIRSANRAAAELFGPAPDGLVGQPIAAVVPEAAAVLGPEAAAPGGMASLLGTTREVQGLTPRGARVPLAMSLTEVGRGRERQFLASFHDLSPQRLIEEQQRAFASQLELTVQNRTAELRRVNDELESFAYSVAHDLRAPARHVHGFARLLETRHAGALDAKARDYVGRIVRAAVDMGRLIDDLLAFSQLGHRQLEVGPVDLDALVAQCRLAMQGTPGSDRVEWRVGPLPTVQGDAGLLRLALSNLLGNAVKYSANCANPVVEIFADASSPSENRICIKDNGVGFDMQYAHQLFKVFSRLHHGDEFEGTGVGLANVRRIVERHGGRIWAHAEPGGGAQFWLALPASPAQGAAG